MVVEDKTTPKPPESSVKNQDENLDGLDLRDLMKLSTKKNDSVLNQMSTLMEEFTNKRIKDAFTAINDSESNVVKHVKVIEDNETYLRNSVRILSGEQKQLNVKVSDQNAEIVQLKVSKLVGFNSWY